MWRPYIKSPIKIHNSSSHSCSSFHCSSFKDIQSLCTDDPTPLHNNNNNNDNTVRKPSIFHRVRLAKAFIRSLKPEPETTPQTKNDTSAVEDRKALLQVQQHQPTIRIPGADKRVVVYFTSLRVVRSTFEDCKTVRSILRGFRVQLDERDLSMDSSFLNELQGILGVGGGGQSKLTLPRVFIGGRYIGGAEEVKQLNETGELKKFVEGFPAAEPGVCDACGGYSYILCSECCGSHKIYTEKGGGFKSCNACNENGLIRCPSCSYAPF